MTKPTALRWLALAAILVAVVGIVGWRATRTIPSDRPLTMVISGDTAGWIVPCGCTANQSGGLLRRATYVMGLGDQLDVVYADAGGAASGISEYQRVKFEAILRGELAIHLAAHNIGGSEAAFGSEYLRTLQRDLNVPFVSANAVNRSGEPVVETVRIVERSGRKIAITGVLSKRYATADCAVTDPTSAVLNVAMKVKSQVDRFIVLAYLPEDELRALAAAVPEADAIIGGPTGQTLSPQSVGSTTLASATNKGKFLVRLDAGKSDRSWTGEVIELGPTYSDDPGQQANIRGYLDELTKKDVTAIESGLAPTIPANLRDGFRIAGSASCVACHEKDCTSWAASKHAKAWNTLTERGYHVDSYCQQCHTTGFGLPGGFASASKAESRHSVGCESCHGPSAAHAKSPTVRTSYAAKDQCQSCHDPENSPLFKYDAYWPRVRHGEPASQKGAGK